MPMFRDLRYGFRIWRKAPGLAVVAIITLAIGIGANTAVFSWIDSLLLHPLPGTGQPAELTSFETLTPSGEAVTTSYEDYRDYRDHLNLLAGLAVAQPRALSIGEQEHSERVWGELVSGNYFTVLRVAPALGRTFSVEEYGDKAGGYPVAVIGYGLWQRLFNSEPGAIGRTIRVNGQRLSIVGVAPKEFSGTIPGLAFEIWVPAMMGTQLNLMPDWMIRDRQTRSFVGIARLKPGVTLERARAEIASLAQHLATLYPGTNRGMGATVLPVWQGHFGAQSLMLKPLQILMAVCGIVLLIVCANLANLLLARATTRQKEFSVRMAIGAGRARLIRQTMTENLVLVALGALAGIPLAIWMQGSLGYLVPPGVFPITFAGRLSGDVLVFILLLCVVACVLSGMWPALQGTRRDLTGQLNEGGRGGTAGTRSQRMRGILVGSEVALALVAMIGAGLFSRSFKLASQINPGFDPEHVAVAFPYLSTARYSVPARKEFCRRLRERVLVQPGVIAATYADVVPLGFGGDPWEDLQIQGYVPNPAENMKIYRNVVAPGYFDLMRISMLDGRDFTELDDENSQPVMIINEAFAHRYFPGKNPIGYKVRGFGRQFSIVGIVKDSKYSTLNETPRPYFYVPFRQVYRADLSIAFYIRVAGDARGAIPLLRREVREIDSDVGVFDATPLTEFIGASLFAQKLAASLLSVLGAIALVLAVVGLYGVVAYTVTLRTHELGIRMALGARPADVLGMVVRQGMLLVLAGLAVGIAASLAVTRLASGLLINLSATDPVVFVAAPALLAFVAAVASFVPAWRAARIDPNIALRFR
jgi:predicted permease